MDIYFVEVRLFGTFYLVARTLELAREAVNSYLHVPLYQKDHFERSGRISLSEYDSHTLMSESSVYSINDAISQFSLIELAKSLENSDEGAKIFFVNNPSDLLLHIQKVDELGKPAHQNISASEGAKAFYVGR